MNTKFIEKIFPFIESSIGIVEHGSTAMGFSNTDSDVDLIAVYNSSDVEKVDKLVVQIIDDVKYHIKNITIKEFENIISNFTDNLLNSKHDLNFLSGRILSGKIIKDTDNKLSQDIVRANQAIDFDLLYKKFYYQLLNDLKDLSIQNIYGRKIVIESIGDDLSFLLLMKNKATSLNGKWIPQLVQNIAPDWLFKIYIQIRFSTINVSDSEISLLVKKWVKYTNEL
jgi:predicted nucleotidyltransferase